jgi:transcriptional regulator with XRE-family HTH domain
MTAEQFRAALKRLGLTQAELATLFNAGQRTVQRWAAEGCSGSDAILLYLMAKGAVSKARVAAASAVCAR